jgi:hypothetical protein
MTTLRLSLFSLGGLALATAGAIGIARAAFQRADCPGTIKCLISGETICRDQCPTIDPNRPDCPGRIECPLTGDLVCVDQCPVDQQKATTAPTRASCCLSAGRTP